MRELSLGEFALKRLDILRERVDVFARARLDSLLLRLEGGFHLEHATLKRRLLLRGGGETRGERLLRRFVLLFGRHRASALFFELDSKRRRLFLESRGVRLQISRLRRLGAQRRSNLLERGLDVLSRASLGVERGFLRLDLRARLRERLDRATLLVARALGVGVRGVDGFVLSRRGLIRQRHRLVETIDDASKTIALGL